MGYIGKVDIGGTQHLVASTLYGTCSTAAATAQKDVSLADFDELITGITIHVKFTNSNTHATPTLKVGSTAAKQIMRYGTTKPSTSAATSWNAGSVISFTYDGTYWQMNDWLNNNDNTYVTQTLRTTDANYPILLSYYENTDTTTNRTNRSYRNNNVYVNTSTNTLHCTSLELGSPETDGVLKLYQTGIIPSDEGGVSGYTSGTLLQKFNGRSNSITNYLPSSNGNLLNNTDFNNNRELQIYESLNSTMGQDDISYEVTNIKDKIKYIDIFFTDNNFHKGWSGGLNIISENYGYLRIPYDQISKDPLSDSSRFSLFLFGDESSYYIRKRTYYIYETEASSGVYNLYIAASTNNKDLLVQFYGNPGTGSWSNMTVRAQYSTGIKIYRVKLILDL